MGETNKRIGLTCGAFDLLHTGHILMLEEAKEQCDYLIVGLQTDPSIDRPNKNKPVETFQERYLKLLACKYVDRIVVYTTEDELYNILKDINPDVRIIGEDHKGHAFTGLDLNIPTYYNSREHKFSSSSLRERVYKLEKEKRHE